MVVNYYFEAPRFKLALWQLLGIKKLPKLKYCIFSLLPYMIFERYAKRIWRNPDMFFKNPSSGLPGSQSLSICLIMQGTWVRSLVWEDHICRGASTVVPPTTEPEFQSPCFTAIEAAAMRSPHTSTERSLRLPQLEKNPATKTQHRQKQRNKFLRKSIFLCLSNCVLGWIMSSPSSCAFGISDLEMVFADADS